MKRSLEKYLSGLYKKQKEEEVKEEPDNIYERYLTKPFPKVQRNLPIVAEDFCYTMDIMFMRPDVVEDIEWGIEKRKTTASKFDSPWSCALVIVETTSRMAWAYPMKSKNSKEVLGRFLEFLQDIDFKISRLITDFGNEYSRIVQFNKEHIKLPDEPNGLFKYYQVNASQNRHTALSRVDRFIRTLRRMLKIHKERFPDIDWADALPNLIHYYNHTTHHSLRAGYYYDRRYYTPIQVYLNPHVRRQQKILDYLKKYKGVPKYKNYEYYRKYYKPGTMVHYRVMPGGLREKNLRGYISQYPANIEGRVGNSFFIRMKNSDDVKRDKKVGMSSFYNGPRVLVPARDLIRVNKPIEGVQKKNDLPKMDLFTEYYKDLAERTRKLLKEEIEPKQKKMRYETVDDYMPQTKKERYDPEVSDVNILPPGSRRQRRAPKRFY